MLRNQNIICISSIDWDFLWQGHQEIMSTFAKAGNRVLFIENTGVRTPGIRDFGRIKQRIKNWLKGVKGIREQMPNLYVFSPIILPFPYMRLARWINRFLILSVLEKWMRIADFYDALIWTFLPTPLSLDIINNLQHRGLVYYCIDNFRASSAAAKRINQYEIRLLKQADLIFVTSGALYDYCSSCNKNVHIFPFAVNFEEFEKVGKGQNARPKDLRNIKRPIIGYVGGIHKWIDQELIKEVAQKSPGYSFVFVGPLQTDISLLAGINNLYFLGNKEHKDIPYFIKYFDACVIPYLVSDYTKNVYPTKLNEYHALGKPVIATPIPEIINFNGLNRNLVLIGKTANEFAECIHNAINNPDITRVEERIDSAKANSWQKRIGSMSVLLKEMIEKRMRLPLNWQDKLLSFYRLSRRKISLMIGIAICIYLLVYYTPFIWFIARPLKISEPPVKADCIVVLGGGVGESGKAGQGYEERVQYAAQLYKEGYAKNIIFSSGYTYVFKEPVIMKALAISLGVPDKAITLEDEATNTYENILFTKEILDREGWNKILLVSSPYHMRRISFVFHKLCPDLTAILTPLPKSMYYSYEPIDSQGRKKWKHISLEQIRGILHEYLGISYYWWKGYI